MEQEAGQGAADAIADIPPYLEGHNSGGSGGFNNPMSFSGAMPGGLIPAPSEGIDVWFAVEPTSAISASCQFP